MKGIIPIVAALCMSCSTHQQQTAVVIDPNDYIPRKEFELTVEDYTAHQSSPHTEEVAEHIRFENSVAKINSDIADEILKMQMCYEEYNRKHAVCMSLKKQLCSIDELIDSRGDIHKKPFCAP